MGGPRRFPESRLYLRYPLMCAFDAVIPDLPSELQNQQRERYLATINLAGRASRAEADTKSKLILSRTRRTEFIRPPKLSCQATSTATATHPCTLVFLL